MKSITKKMSTNSIAKKSAILILTVIMAVAGAAPTYAASAETTVSADAEAAKKTVAQKKAAFLKDKRFRHGAKWAAGKTPILSSAKGTGCYAYAADFVKYVYNKKSPTAGKKFTKPSEIRSGDVLKVVNSQHWICVISRSGKKLKTAEGNWGGVVRVSEKAYTVENGVLKLNGKKFRTFSAGWHFE